MTTEEKQEFTQLKYIRVERYWTPNEALRYDELAKKNAKSFTDKMNKILLVQKQIENN